MDTDGKMNRMKKWIQKLNFNLDFNNISIRMRILLSFNITIVLTIIVIQIIFSIFVKSYYYSGVEQLLKDKANFNSNFINIYAPSKDIHEKSKLLIKNMTDLEREKYFVQVIDHSYNVVMDLDDFSSISKITSVDVKDAMDGRVGVSIEKTENTDEKVMSVSMPLRKYNTVIGVLRYTTSLQEIDRAIKRYYTQISIVGMCVLTLFLLISLVISKSITIPIRKLNMAADEMAKGDFDVRAEKIYDDEIGQLADTLNYLASEITKSEKIKKDFISSISHELRTPLTSIKGWGETLLLDAEENDDLNMGLSIICAEAERLGNIVEELLDFSRLESNAMKIFKDWISPKKILQEVYNQFLPRKGSLEFKCELKGKDSLIYADKNRLKQIFINLIANSMKFTPHGSIFVSAEGFDDRVVFEICDTGIGIAKTDLEKVRERFYKVNINAPGSGMGLSIVEEILKLHDATMEIYSEVGEGTTVKIIFPIKNASYS